MNYYSIEFFKHYIKELKNLNKRDTSSSHRSIESILSKMSAFVSDREQSNKSAYSTKHMRKPIFL